MTVIYGGTGHRPKDLPRDFGQLAASRLLDQFFIIRPTDEIQFITGGALGWDTWMAEYALTRGIPLNLILPFPPHVMANHWNDFSRRTLEAHIALARSVTILHQKYDIAQYQLRNEAMVDGSTEMLALWSGKQFGGTWNCIQYALRVGKPVINLLPGPWQGIVTRRP